MSFFISPKNSGVLQVTTRRMALSAIYSNRERKPLATIWQLDLGWRAGGSCVRQRECGPAITNYDSEQ